MIKLKKSLPALVVSIMYALVWSLTTMNYSSAISYLGPDPNDYGNSNALYIVAHTPSNNSRTEYDQTILKVPIYYNNPDANGTAREPTNDVSLRVYDIHRGISGYDPRNQYISVGINDGLAQPASQRFYTGRYITVPADAFHLDDDPDGTGMFRAVITIRLYNGLSNDRPEWRYMNQVSFRLSLPNYNNRWIIGNSYPNARFSTIAADVTPGQSTDTYNIPFATPCKITSRTSGTIHLYDLDDVTSSPANNSDNEYHNITTTIFRTDLGRVKTGPRTGQWPIVSPTSTGGSRGSGGDYRMTMNFNPGARYLLHISGISPINLLQYSFPYEGVNSLIKCITPSTDEYNLNPSVGLDQNSAIEAGATVTATPSVENTGDLDSPSTTEWELRRTVNAEPATRLDNSSRAFPANDTTILRDTSDDDTDYPVGTVLCYTLRVSPNASGTTASVTGWKESDPSPTGDNSCVTIGKKPKTQIWGGDLNVRGNVTTSTSVKSGHRYGSWAEYGIIASGGISGAASGAAFAGPNGFNSAASACNYSTLSFTNAINATCDTTVIGNYSNAGSIPDIAAHFSGSGTNRASGSYNISGWSGINTVDGDLTIQPSAIPAGRTIIVKATGSVRIGGDITYAPGPYTRISQLPQVIIISNDITIYNAAQTVDAWLVAIGGGNGTIRTCEEVGDAAGVCNNPLIVNGPVMTDKLYLYRTSGSNSGRDSGDPAEVFNLRADAYLWAQAQASSSGRARTVYITELPPRF